MTQINDGGPAFPAKFFDEKWNEIANTGMTLRDWFAGQAMAGLLTTVKNGIDQDDGFLGDDARLYYAIADAMIAAREVKP
jgi:hypothetical protein